MCLTIFIEFHVSHLNLQGFIFKVLCSQAGMWMRGLKCWIPSWLVWIICIFIEGAVGSIPKQKCAGIQIDPDVYHGG